MTDMPYLTVDECVALGYEPLAVYGGKVYSLSAPDFDGVFYTITHGGLQYALVLDQLKLQQLGAPQ